MQGREVCNEFRRQDAFDRYVLGHMAEEELAQFEEHLLLCVDCMHQVEQADAFAGAVKASLQTEPEQRREPRRSAGFDLDLRLAHPGGKSITARVVDISKSGMGLRLREMVAPGAVLCSPKEKFAGTVCYCVNAADGYRVGLALAS